MRKPKLIPSWKRTAKHAWSVRFMALSGFCSVGEVIVTYFPNALPRGAMAGLAGSFVLGGIIARFYQQRNMKNGDE